MDKHRENKLTMYLGVKSVLEENVTKTDTLPALGAPIAKFNLTVAAIEAKSKEFDLAATGKTQVKTDTLEELIDELVPAVSSLAAYAHAKKNTELLAKASVPESTFQRLRDTEIVTKANGLFETCALRSCGLRSDSGGADITSGKDRRVRSGPGKERERVFGPFKREKSSLRFVRRGRYRSRQTDRYADGAIPEARAGLLQFVLRRTVHTEYGSSAEGEGSGTAGAAGKLTRGRNGERLVGAYRDTPLQDQML